MGNKTWYEYLKVFWLVTFLFPQFFSCVLSPASTIITRQNIAFSGAAAVRTVSSAQVGAGKHNYDVHFIVTHAVIFLLAG